MNHARKIGSAQIAIYERLSNSLLIRFSIHIFFFSVLAAALPSFALTVNDCGSVVGHEMGLWDFFSTSTNPGQVNRVRKTDLKFVKVSLQKLKDNHWVVAHDETQAIFGPGGRAMQIRWRDLTREDLEAYRHSPDYTAPIYYLKDFISRDGGALCWMFSPKQSSNWELVSELMELGALERSVILTRDLEEVHWFNGLPSGLNLHISGRIKTAHDLDLLNQAGANLWAIEIEKSDETQTLVGAVKAQGTKAYVDSMGYSKNYEFSDSACDIVFALGADVTQTNRPLKCLKKIHQ